MVYIQRQRPSSAVAFLAHRLYRVVPLYWGLTLLYIVLYVTWPQLFGLATVDITRVVQTMSFTTFFTADSLPVLYLGWTLEYEMFFYFAFAAALLAGTVVRAVAISSGLIIFGFFSVAFGSRGFGVRPRLRAWAGLRPGMAAAARSHVPLGRRAPPRRDHRRPCARLRVSPHLLGRAGGNWLSRTLR